MLARQKEQQRREVLARRDRMDKAVRVHFSHSLVDYADVLLSTPSACIVSTFLPIRSEIDPRPLMACLRTKSVRPALPALLHKPVAHIIFRAFEGEDDLIAMGFGTSGPREGAPIVEPDVILLPLAAYDGRGNRIGYGGGHYDRAIADMRARGFNPRLVGLAFSCQEVENIAAEAHDIRLDAILTEQGLRYFP